MKEINLKSLVEAYENIDRPLFEKYMKYNSINIKDAEKEDIKKLIEFLAPHLYDSSYFNKYYFWFSIPQIWKEFDLLRFWSNYNINIELKSCSVPVDKIKEQLLKNKYYLDFLSNITYYFTFVSSLGRFYMLGDSDELIVVDEKVLIKKIENQDLEHNSTLYIETLFNPSNYLVSPFNSTKEFVDWKYFLTNQQEDFKKNILKEIEKKDKLLFWLTWSPWTWKTLLTYDIAKLYLWKVLIIHCWKLNKWHEKLINDFKRNIISVAKLNVEIYESKLENYELIIIDEAQRIFTRQYDYIKNLALDKKIPCLFSYDKEQTLKINEWTDFTELEKDENFKFFELTKKIRTNEGIANFIKWLFVSNINNLTKISKSNITLNYFTTESEASKYIDFLLRNEWKKIDYTPSNHHLEQEKSYSIYNLKKDGDNAHDVIWQEFDKVIVVIDKLFYYNEKHNLISKYKDPYYSPTKMLFQMITRVRKKLSVIIIDNPEVMNRCLDLLNKKDI